jgi:WD40 repeat protein
MCNSPREALTLETLRLRLRAGAATRHAASANQRGVGVALTADGRLLAGGGLDGTVMLWETSGGRLLAMLQGHTGGVWGISLSTDGRLLASGGFDGTLRLWDARSGAGLRTMRSDRRYERVDITGLTSVTAAQRARCWRWSSRAPGPSQATVVCAGWT